MKTTLFTIPLIILPLISQAENKTIDLRVAELERRVETLEKLLASSGSATQTTTNQIKKSVPAIPERKNGLTIPQNNAIRSAKQYLSISGFSRSGLIRSYPKTFEMWQGDCFGLNDAETL